MFGPALAPLAAALALLGGVPAAAPGTAEAEAKAAIEAGRLRLSASVSAGRLRVALVDEDERVGRVHAFAVQTGERRMLPRLDTTAADRIEFAIDGEPGAPITIRVEAYQRHTDPPVLLHAIDLEAPPPLPLAPSANATAATVPAADTSVRIPWWLIAGAVVATALAGVAVYQEID